MNSSMTGILLALLAGIATVLGGLIVILFKNKNHNRVGTILGFSAGIMLVIVFMDLLPEAIEFTLGSLDSLWGMIIIILSIIVGIVLTYFLDKLLHHHSDEDNLYHVGIMTTIGISLHKVPEGIAIFIASYADVRLGVTMALAIAIHHIPAGMAIATPIYYATGSKFKALKFPFLSSLAEPAGALLAFLFLKPFINNLLLGILFSIAIGIFLFIIIEELIPASRKHGSNKLTMYSLLIGMIFMFIFQNLF